MEIRIQEEDYEALRNIVEKIDLNEGDIKRLSLVLQRVGVILNLREFIAIKSDDKIIIMSPGVVVTISIDVYEGSILLNLQIENSINYNMLSIELIPKERDELVEALKKIRGKGW